MKRQRVYRDRCRRGDSLEHTSCVPREVAGALDHAWTSHAPAIRSDRAQRVDPASAWLRGGIVPAAALTGKRFEATTQL
jgi:hypothetical protein